eukprot:8594772-Pyramimonas_sp.AAC.1
MAAEKCPSGPVTQGQREGRMGLLADGGVAAPEAHARGIPEEEVARWSQDPAFEEVPAELLHAGRWRTVLADRWAFGEGIPHLEGRALIKA